MKVHSLRLRVFVEPLRDPAGREAAAQESGAKFAATHAPPEDPFAGLGSEPAQREVVLRGACECFLKLQCFLEFDVVGGHRPNGSRAGAFLKLETSIWSPPFRLRNGVLCEPLAKRAADFGGSAPASTVRLDCLGRRKRVGAARPSPALPGTLQPARSCKPELSSVVHCSSRSACTPRSQQRGRGNITEDGPASIA